MKTEAEIRAHLKNLTKLHEIPCRCEDPIDRMRCFALDDRTRQQIAALAWVLGEDETYDGTVKAIAAALAVPWKGAKKT